jgi:hypothetical protein
MSTGWYNKELSDLVATLTGCKVMLVGSGYTYNPDHDYVSQVNSAEISCSGYTGGFGGAGRKALTLTPVEDDANDRAIVKIADVTWTALGTGATIAAAVIVREGTSDADSKLVAHLDIPDTPTNGSNFTLTFDATNGNLRLVNQAA